MKKDRIVSTASNRAMGLLSRMLHEGAQRLIADALHTEAARAAVVRNGQVASSPNCSDTAAMYLDWLQALSCSNSASALSIATRSAGLTSRLTLNRSGV
jgi:hypothetical protein